MKSSLLYLALLAMLSALVGCASETGAGARTQTYFQGGEIIRFDPDKDSYWKDPKWDKALLDAIQASVHNPVDPSDMSTPGLHAVVKFTYLAGTAEYPEIIQGTGVPDKDELLLHQLASTRLPAATGIDADEPHEFVLDLKMPTPYETFEDSVITAVDYAKIYPKEAIIAGEQGATIVSFDYLDGKLRNVVVIKPSGRRSLDKASVEAVARAAVPAPPAAYAGKILHFEPEFCYSLNGPGRCLDRKDVIQIFGTRIRRVGL